MCETFLASSDIQNVVESCNRDGHDCSPNARCPETKDGYTCVCKPGYIGDGKTCKYSRGLNQTVSLILKRN